MVETSDREMLGELRETISHKPLHRVSKPAD
jgi:hypothetical protein